MKKVIFQLVTLCCLAASAQGPTTAPAPQTNPFLHQIAPGLMAIDREGTSVWLSENHVGAIFLFGEAAAAIKASVNYAQPDSSLLCNDIGCAIMGLTQSGTYGTFPEREQRFTQVTDIPGNGSLNQRLWLQDMSSRMSANPSQYDNEEGLIEVTLNGLTAEQFYNFLTLPELDEGVIFKRSELVECELRNQYPEEAWDEGVLRSDARLSYREYTCTLKINRATGQISPSSGDGIGFIPAPPPPPPADGSTTSTGGGG